MPFSGRWHLFALCGCFAAWASLGEHSWVPMMLILIYGLFLVIRKNYALLIAIFLVFIVIKIDLMFFQLNQSVLSGKEKILYGRIADLPQFDGNMLKFQLKTSESESVLTYVKLHSKAEKDKLIRELKPGMVCRVSGKLEKPSQPSNFHAFNQRLYLSRHHIYWQFKASHSPSYARAVLTPYNMLQRIRENQIRFISTNFSSSSAEMMNALLFGDDSGMNDDLTSAYRMFGLVHLLVVSGMHVVVVFGTLFYLLRRAGVIREFALILLILLIPVYVVLTGAEASIIRSGLTAIIVLLFELFRKRRLPVSDPISLACLLMVAYDPNLVFDLGFQLSFVVTFIVLIAGPLVIHSYQSSIVRTITLTLICELATFPITVLNFYQLSLAGILLSIFFVPFITVIIFPLCTAAFISSLFFMPLADFLSFVTDLLLYIPHYVLLYLYNHPPLQLNYGALTGWETSGSILMVAAAFVTWESQKGVKAIVVLFAPFLLMYVWVYAADYANPYGSVTFLDVGQGDSILIQLPHKQGTLLIDTGGTIPYRQEKWERRKKPFEVGRDVVLHELMALRINQLDAMVLTHRDFDHIGGMKGIAGKIVINKLLISPYHDPDKTDRALFRKMINEGTRLSLVHASMVIKIGDASFHVLSPNERSRESNDNSIVLHVELGGKSWMFTGDLSQNGEKSVMKRYPYIRADVLKLGHHGSRTSTSELWLDQLRPAIGIISCGKNNRYGHPHQEVVQALQKRNIRSLRTDQVGAISFSFDQDHIVSIKSALSP